VGDRLWNGLGKNYHNKFFLWMHLYDPHFPLPSSLFHSASKQRAAAMMEKSHSPMPKWGASSLSLS